MSEWWYQRIAHLAVVVRGNSHDNRRSWYVTVDFISHEYLWLCSGPRFLWRSTGLPRPSGTNNTSIVQYITYFIWPLTISKITHVWHVRLCLRHETQKTKSLMYAHMQSGQRISDPLGPLFSSNLLPLLKAIAYLQGRQGKDLWSFILKGATGVCVGQAVGLVGPCTATPVCSAIGAIFIRTRGLLNHPWASLIDLRRLALCVLQDITLRSKVKPQSCVRTYVMKSKLT